MLCLSGFELYPCWVPLIDCRYRNSHLLLCTVLTYGKKLDQKSFYLMTRVFPSLSSRNLGNVFK